MTMLFAMTLTSTAAGDLGLKQTKAYSTSATVQWTATAGVKYDVYVQPTVKIKGKTYKGMVTGWTVIRTYTRYY